MKSSVTAVLVLFLAFIFGCAHDSGQYGQRSAEHCWRSPIIDAFDVNHDGIIDSNEIANASSALLKLDKNKDGQLTYDEIHWPTEPEHPGEPEPVIQVLDANHDDIIDATEIANAPAALRKLDKNADGQLTPDEYTPPHMIAPARSRESETNKRSSGEYQHHRGSRGSTSPADASAGPLPQP